MPELPEVETVCRGLSKVITGKKIYKIRVLNPKLRYKIPDDLENKIKSKNVKKILRRGKYGLLVTDGEYDLAFHLGMTGNFIIYNSKPKIYKHDHLLFQFDKNIFIVYNDIRKFGYIFLTKKPLDLSNFKNLGVEPDQLKNQKNILYKQIKKKNSNIKSVLLDQGFIAGIGNIYASEILYVASVSPKRKARNISKVTFTRLLKACNTVILNAISKGGASIKNFNDIDGKLGYFQNEFKVYAREGLSCFACGNLIKKIKQNGRSTFYCIKCQR